MLKFQLATKKDLKEAAIIENKKKIEEERKSRIFNARNRIIGVDTDGINRQIYEKQCIRDGELEQERKFLEEQNRRADIIRAKEANIEKERQRIQNEIIEYRNKYQRREDTREFDLNDPKYILKTLPARVGDNDVRLGISSAQKFIGEDLMCSERKKAQQEQQKAWLLQQIKEREKANNDRIAAERVIQDAIIARDKRTMDLQNAEHETKRKMHAFNAKYNLSLANEQLTKNQRKKQHEYEDNLAEIYNHLSSDFLNENPDCANSNFGPKRKVTTNYKGMSEMELTALIRDREIQCARDVEKRANDQQIEQKWNQMSTNFDKIAQQKDREMAVKMKQIQGELLTKNEDLAMEQKTKNEYLNKVVYTNQPTSEYFAQFNTSTR